jgi:DNA polymerase-3 subunit beta
MIFSVERSILASTVSRVKRIAGQRAMFMQVTKNLLVQIKDREMSVAGTNLDMYASIHAGHVDAEDITFLVNADLLNNILSTLRDEPVEFETNGKSLKIKQKETVFTLALGDPEDFPSVPQVEGTEYSVPSAIFCGAVNSVLPFSGNEKDREVLCSVHLECRDGKINAVASNGAYLAVRTVEVTGSIEPFEITIPKQSAAYLPLFFSDEADLTLKVDKGGINLDGKKTSVYLRVLETKYPDWKLAFPNKDGMIRLKVDGQAFMEAAEKVYLLESRATKIECEDGKVTFSGTGEMGSVLTSITGSCTGKTEVNFDPKMLYQIAKRLIGEVVIYMPEKGMLSPCVFEPSADETYLLMPVQIE